jgi:hypothetical protein
MNVKKKNKALAYTTEVTGHVSAALPALTSAWRSTHNHTHAGATAEQSKPLPTLTGRTRRSRDGEAPPAPHASRQLLCDQRPSRRICRHKMCVCVCVVCVCMVACMCMVVCVCVCVCIHTYTYAYMFVYIYI